MKLKTFFACLTAVLAMGCQMALAQFPGGMPGPGAGFYPGAAPPTMMAPGMMPGMAPGGMPGMMPANPIPTDLGGAPIFDATQAAFLGGDTGVGGKACDGGKGCKGCDSCCGGWCHHFFAFGEFLYLRARDSEVAFAVPVNGPIVPPVTATPIEVGRVGSVDQDFTPAFRLGFGFALNPYSSITAQYSMLESEESDAISTTAPFVIRNLVSHPSTLTAGRDWLDAEASHAIDWDIVDLDYRGMIQCCDLYQTNFLFGVRYGQLEQEFDSLFSGNGTESVYSNVRFYGAGLRAGLEGERYTWSRRLLVYGKLHGSLLAGEFKANYEQNMSFDPTVATTSTEAGRLVPVVDLEIGGGWQSKCGTWRLTGGYVYSGWYNMLKTDRWIDNVQRGQFITNDDTITFDGFVARVEGRF